MPAAPAAAAQPKASEWEYDGRYDQIINRMQSVLREKEETLQRSQTPERTLVLENERAVLRHAIELFESAKTIEPKMTTFGINEASLVMTPPPASLKEFSQVPSIGFVDFVTRTSEPVQIAFLRGMIGTPGGEQRGLVELQNGLVGAMSKENLFIGYVDQQTYQMLGQSKLIRLYHHAPTG